MSVAIATAAAAAAAAAVIAISSLAAPSSPSRIVSGLSISPMRQLQPRQLCSIDSRRGNTAGEVPHSRCPHHQGNRQLTPHGGDTREGAASNANSTCNANSNATDNDNDALLDNVSDEEILLACRAYLSRRHKVPWMERDRRREARRQQLQLMGSGVRNGAVGYFWEDPAQLRTAASSAEDYYHQDPRDVPPTTALENDDDDDNDADDEDSEDNDNDFAQDDSSLGDAGFFDEYDQQYNDNDYGEFGTDHLDENDFFWPDKDLQEHHHHNTASASSNHNQHKHQQRNEQHINRSKAAKRTWTDPIFRKQWYEKRWGADPTTTTVTKQQQKEEKRKKKQLDNKMQSLLLQSSTTDTITASTILQDYSQLFNEEELIDMIRIYIQGNKKRSRIRRDMSNKYLFWRLQQIPKKQNFINTTTTIATNRDDLTKTSPSPTLLTSTMSREESILRSNQFKRSEKAKRAYQTRIANQKKIKLQQQQQQEGKKKENNIGRTSSRILKYEKHSLNRNNNKLIRHHHHHQQQQQLSEIVEMSDVQCAMTRIDSIISIFSDSNNTRNSRTTTNNDYCEREEEKGDSNDFTGRITLPSSTSLTLINDLKCVLRPRRLSKRRPLLLKLLKERYNVYGKICIEPLSATTATATTTTTTATTREGNGWRRTMFISNCNIEQLGQLAIQYALKESERDGDEVGING